MMWRIVVATVLLTLAMGSTDRDTAGLWYYAMPFMVLIGVCLIVDAAKER